MKKTLIALTVVASAVSGMAHAWTNGDFSGNVDIGGSITVDDYHQKWAWAVGSDITGFSNALTDMTENGTKLTITVIDNKPILLGKTLEAFAAPVLGGVGSIPQIAFTDYEGASVKLKSPDGATNSGMAYIVLPMRNAEGIKVGSVKVNATCVGVAGTTKYKNLKSLYSSNEMSIFNGGFPTNEPQSVVWSGNVAAAVSALFGSLSSDDILQQLAAVDPSITQLTNQSSPANEDSQYRDGHVFSAAYVLGIVSGQTIEATFDHSVTASTEWSAPLGVTVSYN